MIILISGMRMLKDNVQSYSTVVQILRLSCDPLQANLPYLPSRLGTSRRLFWVGHVGRTMKCNSSVAHAPSAPTEISLSHIFNRIKGTRHECFLVSKQYTYMNHRCVVRSRQYSFRLHRGPPHSSTFSRHLSDLLTYFDFLPK